MVVNKFYKNCYLFLGIVTYCYYICLTIAKQSNQKYLQMQTQIKQEYADKLKELSEEVTSEDKLNAAVNLGVHPLTIHRYLNGEAKKNGFARKLIEFLKREASNNQ